MRNSVSVEQIQESEFADGYFPLAPMWEREEFVDEHCEFTNSGEGLFSPLPSLRDTTSHKTILNRFVRQSPSRGRKNYLSPRPYVGERICGRTIIPSPLRGRANLRTDDYPLAPCGRGLGRGVFHHCGLVPQSP